MSRRQPAFFRQRLLDMRDEFVRNFRLTKSHLKEVQTVFDPSDRATQEMGLNGRSIEATNAAIVIDPYEIQVVPRGWVALLSKGEGYEGNLNRAIVHRSPPLADDTTRRLRLCIEPVPAHVTEEETK